MAQPQKSNTIGELLHARYPNLTHCKACDAIYSPSDKWVKGYCEEGTAGGFQPMRRVPEDKCPICLTQQE